MKTLSILLLVLLTFGFYFSSSDEEIDIAYHNAKKGVFWALSNIPEKKTKIIHQLVSENKLYSTVKLYKRINGVKVESTGYCNSNEVTIVLYKSVDSLLSEGYIKDKKIVEGDK
jgi:hypothetical protein